MFFRVSKDYLRNSSSVSFISSYEDFFRNSLLCLREFHQVLIQAFSFGNFRRNFSKILSGSDSESLQVSFSCSSRRSFKDSYRNSYTDSLMSFSGFSLLHCRRNSPRIFDPHKFLSKFLQEFLQKCFLKILNF